MLLDTNAYTALLLNKSAVVALTESSKTIVLSIPVIAELRYGFRLGTREVENERKLQAILSQPQTQVLTLDLHTTEHYAYLAEFCKRSGRSLVNNDLWIAALARQHDLQLVTYDRDFQVFSELLGEKLSILD